VPLWRGKINKIKKEEEDEEDEPVASRRINQIVNTTGKKRGERVG